MTGFYATDHVIRDGYRAKAQYDPWDAPAPEAIARAIDHALTYAESDGIDAPIDLAYDADGDNVDQGHVFIVLVEPADSCPACQRLHGPRYSGPCSH